MTTEFESEDQWQDRLSEYVDGLLPPPEVRALEAHLETCESCRKAVNELREVVNRLRSDRVDNAPADTWQRIASRLGTPTMQRNRGRAARYSEGVHPRTLRTFAVAAALTFTFVGGLWAGVTFAAIETLSQRAGWLTMVSRKLHIPSRTFPLPYAADSLPDEWIPLRRSLAELDRQLGSANAALQNAPGNERLRRVVQQLTRERDDLRAVLDSVARSR